MRFEPRRPRVSVVIASRSEPERLSDWLPELADECTASAVELIVVRAGDVVGIRDRMQQSAVSVLSSGSASDGDALRRIGLAAASGDIVLLVGDDRALGTEWLASAVAGVLDRQLTGNRPRSRA